MRLNTPHNNNTDHAGFSLLELSIAIAIIALLVTAVIAGQSIRHRLELNRLIDDMGILNNAVKEFKNTYGGLPGDIYNAESLFSQQNVGNKLADNAGDGNGNGNNILEGTLTAPSRNEQLLFWQHLAAAGSIVGTFDGTTISSSGMYASAFKDVLYQPNTDSANKNRLYFVISKLNDTTLSNGAFSTQEAFDYDTKYDDGQAATGKIQALDGANVPAGSCITNNGYNMTNSANEQCQLIFYVE